ncbi:MAG: hypothetical protein IJ859_08215, partial [Synergistaceae bacterium]|nr:hypothetical protein [Synergistaceae bacterium]
EAAYDAAKYVVFFIDESLLAAEEDGMNQATLLNDKGEAITEGTSTYVGAGSLEAGHTYTMYVAEKDTGTEPTNEGGSSGGGCEVGLGLWSLAALVALTKLSGRRYVK